MTIYAEVKCPSCGGTSIWPMPKTDEAEWPTEIMCDRCYDKQEGA